MKKTVLFHVLFLISIIGSSQSLEGEWKGFFTDSKDRLENQTEIFISFKKINDTTFEGISMTIIKYYKETDTTICILQGGFYEENILLLEETRVLKDFTNPSGCLQLMKLYYRVKRKYIELEGDWYTEDDKCGHGLIRLTKPL
jgi:hypothetical protein